MPGLAPLRLSFLAIPLALGLLGCASPDARTVVPWSKRFGDAGAQSVGGVAVFGDGTIALTGAFTRSIDFGGGALRSAGGDDVFVASLDSAGHASWSGRTGSTGAQRGEAVAFAPNGDVLIAGTFTGLISFGGAELATNTPSSGFVARFDATGHALWSRQIDGGSVSLHGLAVGPDGSAVVGGSFTHDASFARIALATDGQAAFLGKLDANGAPVWAAVFTGSNHEVRGVAVDAAGGVVAVGDVSGSIGVGAKSGAADQQSPFVAAFDASGDARYLDVFNVTQGAAQANAVALDAGGNALIAGQTYADITFGTSTVSVLGNGEEAFVARVSRDGAPQWMRPFGGDRAPRVTATSIAVDAADHAILTGAYQGDVDFGGGFIGARTASAPFLVELDGRGAHVTSRGFGVEGNVAEGSAIAVDPAGALVLAGTFSGSVALGGAPLVAAGDVAAFVGYLKR